VAAPEVVDLTQGWRAHEDMAGAASSASAAARQMVKALERSTTMAQVLLLAPTAAAAAGAAAATGGAEGAARGAAGGAAGASRPVLCVVNTHLFGHPDATHVRLFQSATFMRHVERVAARHAAAAAGSGFAVVVCGDFNSQPEEGVGLLLRRGLVSADHADWQRATRFRLIESRAEREAHWFKRAPGGAEAGADGGDGLMRRGDVEREDGREGREGVGEGAAEEAEVEGFGFEAQEGATDLAFDLRQGVCMSAQASELRAGGRVIVWVPTWVPTWVPCALPCPLSPPRALASRPFRSVDGSHAHTLDRDPPRARLRRPPLHLLHR
jgi:hypothetical protein